MRNRRSSASKELQSKLDKLKLLEAQRLAQIGSWEWEIHGDVIRWSDEIYTMFGVTRSEFSGNFAAFFEHVHPADRAMVRQVVEEALQKQLPFECQYRVCHRDGSERILGVRGAVLTSRAGKPEKMIGTARDVTEQVRTENQQRSLEEQLMQAQKMEALGQLAGGVAHDFNNILVAVRGYCELVMRRLAKGSTEYRMVEKIFDVSNQGMLFAEQLVAFSCTHAADPTVVNLNTVICELEELLQRAIGEDILLAKLLDTNLWNVKGDAGQLGQLIVNLAVNSRDAMPNGGRITVETKNVEIPSGKEVSGVASGRYVKLTVSDNGIGMDEETRSRIFEPFFTTKPKGKGTGLGLATVYGIIKQCRGHIKVDSAVHRGTSFEILLPQSTEQPKVIEEDLSETAVEGGRETVLVVEDDPRAREVTCSFLKELGYNVIEAENGLKALGICQSFRERIDLLITDIVMPGMGGRRLITRAQTFRNDFRTIYMSGYPSPSNGTPLEGAEFIRKPFTFESLSRKVRRALK